MKYTNRRAVISILLSLSVFLFAGCGNLKYEMDYGSVSPVSSFNVTVGQSAASAKPFAADLCVVTGDVADSETVDVSHAEAAVLFDLNNKDVLYAKNAHERLYPASLTKVMTALVALQNGSPDQMLTATNAVKITESGAQLCGLKAGDTMTLDQALHILLMYSANDVANLIAENIGGSVENFVQMMNDEAKRLGATNTHFANAHGLTDEEHYTTAYDLYLIFNEAIRYEKFNEIIQRSSYQTTYYDGNGKAKEVNYSSTNRFVKGDAQAPPNINVVGGKTGTTVAAGSCLMLLSRDAQGAPYISVILRAENVDYLYQQMTDLLDEINN
ncbi:MAG: D-alanyl-D-alanine carboxypeptidase [Clostridium sp.]|nr:D-alanyl-D-alanine carboxypeptidase [Acetatifactor muris]MCM1526509.1 D-alanyl-D-alanine carboxypeptidase [Bacteroides sp.]MCM1562365.1 D-alanyl-D-alanine carboxypeptidase [Clostridium sp.]